VARSAKELILPALFFVEGVFWLGLVAEGGATLLVLGALTGIVSGLLLVALPRNWATRPTAGGSALFGFTLTVFQVYQASTLLGTSLGGLGATSVAVFGVLAVVCAYLELQTLAMGSPRAAKKG
jgi:hypothetical protein